MKKKLYKSAVDKKVFGVCGGLAEYFNIDSTWIRLIFVVLIFGYGTGLLVYLGAALVMPEANANIRKEDVVNNEQKEN